MIYTWDLRVHTPGNNNKGKKRWNNTLISLIMQQQTKNKFNNLRLRTHNLIDYWHSKRWSTRVQHKCSHSQKPNFTISHWNTWLREQYRSVYHRQEMSGILHCILKVTLASTEDQILSHIFDYPVSIVYLVGHIKFLPSR